MESTSFVNRSREFLAAAQRGVAKLWQAGRWVLVGSAIVWGGFWIVLSLILPRIYREHGPMENFHAVTLAMGVLIGVNLMATKRLGAPIQIFGAGVALFHLVLFLLEFDTRLLGMPALERWTNGALRNLWLGVLFAAYGMVWWKNFKSVWPVLLEWLESMPGALIIISGIFWAAGFIVDKSHLADRDVGLFLEEFMECEAALFMGIAILLTRFVWARR